jgi:hypothetical protein
MNLNNRRTSLSRRTWAGIGLSWLLSLSATLGAPFVHAQAAGPQSFATADAAADALVAAARADDPAAMMALLGEDADSLVSSGDDVADAGERARFVEAYDIAHNLAADGADKFTLEVGEDEWPVPIPIIKVGDKWSFDIDAGIDEIAYRRIGRNELGAIETCRGIAEAQVEYASREHDGLPTGIYAQKLVSDAGKQNGLYWKPQPDERASPIGPFLAEAAAEGYGLGSSSAAKPQPYHGYIYRLLTAQGPAAVGGARSYLDDKGKLSGGFAVLAYPVDYESSGVATFIINQDGVLYQKDLGADTEKLAAAVDTFNPDKTWTKVD